MDFNDKENYNIIKLNYFKLIINVEKQFGIRVRRSRRMLDLFILYTFSI